MFRRAFVLLATLAAALALTAGAASAATLVVNTTVDSLNPGPGRCSLREAIQAVDSPGSAAGNCAPAAFGPNTIQLKAATYDLTGGQGTLQIGSTVTQLTIVGAGEGTTVIDARTLGTRAFSIAAGPTVTMRDLTISNSHAPSGNSGMAGFNDVSGGPGGAGANGGAILNAGSLTLLRVAVIDSSAGNGGWGGSSNPSTPVTGPGGNGGAGGDGGDGGGIYNTGTLSLDGVTLASDAAGNGGLGGSAAQGSPGGSGGAGGQGGFGGAVANVGGTLVITASTVQASGSGFGGGGGNGGAANSASDAGGAAGVGGGAGDGGGLWSNGGTVTLTNSTVASNLAGDGGAGGTGGAGGATGAAGGNGGRGGDGGALVAGASGSETLLAVTVVGNRAGGGGDGGAGGGGTLPGGPGTTGSAGTAGGLTESGGASATLEDSLLASNAGGNCGPGTLTDGGHNLSFAASGCPATFATGDPNLGPLQDNGGPTDTVDLGPGSAAIDQVPSHGAGCPSTDQRGLPRPTGKACDIGAYEVTPPTVIPGSVRATGPHSVAITATVAADSASASVSIAGLKKSTVAQVSGLTPTKVVLKVNGLALTRVLSYRVTATSGDGTTNSGTLSFAVPILSRVKATHAVATYVDNRAARTTFVLLRRGRGVISGGVCVAARRGRAGKPCQWIVVATFQHNDRRGRNQVRLPGEKPGRYRLQATPATSSATGVTVTVAMR